MAPERVPLPDVPSDQSSHSDTGLLVPNHVEEQKRKREETCFCGNAATEVFRGWGLCPMCAPGVKRRWRRMNRKPALMAIPKTRKRR